ncbi:MAG: hypothetical protein KIT31_27385 [Deltaproteobacteria bacterium]|nr:hypothetical protein [Deltaproteobacteria bacterium]
MQALTCPRCSEAQPPSSDARAPVTCGACQLVFTAPQVGDGDGFEVRRDGDVLTMLVTPPAWAAVGMVVAVALATAGLAGAVVLWVVVETWLALPLVAFLGAVAALAWRELAHAAFRAAIRIGPDPAVVGSWRGELDDVATAEAASRTLEGTDVHELVVRLHDGRRRIVRCRSSAVADEAASLINRHLGELPRPAEAA